MRASLLLQLQLTTLPEGLNSHHFTRAKLLTYLRAREGDVEKAAARAAECIRFVESEVFPAAKRYEAEYPQEQKDFIEQNDPVS